MWTASSSLVNAAFRNASANFVLSPFLAYAPAAHSQINGSPLSLASFSTLKAKRGDALYKCASACLYASVTSI